MFVCGVLDTLLDDSSSRCRLLCSEGARPAPQRSKKGNLSLLLD